MHHTESKTEEGAVQQRGKVKNFQHGSKKSKGSLRRRMQYILTSPVHLFRRYVLRKRPKNHSKRENGSNEDVENVTVPEAVKVAKQRNLPCYFLFVGLQQSGKSTTISKLFNGKRPTSNNSNVITVYKSQSVGQNIGLKVVDAPGFCGNEQQDAEKVQTLSTFLRQDLPHRIPTVLFVVARMDDDSVDNEEQSQFTRMLTALSHAEKLITDRLYSNVILLLTHSQKANNVSCRISKYQEEFAKVFPVTNQIYVMAIDNIRYNSKSTEKLKNYHEIIFEGLRDFAKKRQEQSLQALMDWFTEESKRFSISFEQELLSKKSLDGNPVTALEHLEKSQQNFEPYFVMHHHTDSSSKKRRKSQKKNNASISEQNPKQLQTCIAPESQIVLADGSLISIDKCLIGDKLLALDGHSSVITEIVKSTEDEVTQECKSVGTIYCANSDPELGEEEKTPNSKFIYSYNNGTFELVEASKANVPEQQSTSNVYFLKLDSLNGTFVMNGFPCFAVANSDTSGVWDSSKT